MRKTPSFEAAPRPEPEQSKEKTIEQLMAELDSEKLTPEQRKELIKEAWDALRDAFIAAGGEFHEDVNEVYRAMKGHELLVRRDDPKRIAKAISDQRDIELGFDPALGEKYANVSVWSPQGDQSGLANAFTEGHGHAGGLVTVMGFEKGGLNVEPVSGPREIGNQKRHLVRSAEGMIRPEDVRFVVIGVPGAFFPEEELTDKELERMEEDGTSKKKESGAKRVFRGFIFRPRGEEGKKAA